MSDTSHTTTDAFYRLLVRHKACHPAMAFCKERDFNLARCLADCPRDQMDWIDWLLGTVADDLRTHAEAMENEGWFIPSMISRVHRLQGGLQVLIYAESYGMRSPGDATPLTLAVTTWWHDLPQFAHWLTERLDALSVHWPLLADEGDDDYDDDEDDD